MSCMTFLFSGYQQEIQRTKSAFCCSQACSFWLCAFILLFISWFAAVLVLGAAPRLSSCSVRGCFSSAGGAQESPAGAPLLRSAWAAARGALQPWRGSGAWAQQLWRGLVSAVRGTFVEQGANLMSLQWQVSSTLAHQGSLLSLNHVTAKWKGRESYKSRPFFFFFFWINWINSNWSKLTDLEIALMVVRSFNLSEL